MWTLQIIKKDRIMAIFSVSAGSFDFDNYFEYGFVLPNPYMMEDPDSYQMEPYSDYRTYASILNQNQFDTTIIRNLSVLAIGGGNLDTTTENAVVQGIVGARIQQILSTSAGGVATVTETNFWDVWSLQDINLAAQTLFDALALADVATFKLLFQEALSGDDEIYLSDDSDTMYAFDGNDVIYGYGGGDVIYAGGGNDWIDEGNTPGGEGGVARLYGGPGNDSYIVYAPLTEVIEDAGQGTDVVAVADPHGGRQWRMGDNVENASLTNTVRYGLVGNGLDNQITGNNAINVLAGKAGNDALRGKGGDDTINGGAGADTITGGAGKDAMNGGFGADRFVFDDPDFGGKTLSSGDLITDFSRGQGDKIALNLVDANTVNGTADDAFTFIGTAAFAKVAGQLRFGTDINSNTFVQGDTNGDGQADFLISLTGSKNLVASDFVL
jgi:Ca2+-binding RTX toxin-like protein